MSEIYRVVVLVDGQVPFAEAETDDIMEAVDICARMRDISIMIDGASRFVFEGNDDIVVVDGEGAVVHAWNRESARDISAYTDIDLEAEHPAVRKLVGWQLGGPGGENIQGDDDDPFELRSFSILVGDAAEAARHWVGENPGYSLLPIHLGDVEAPEYLDHVDLPAARLRTALPSP